MDFNITKEEKIEAINMAIGALKNSFYREILMNGFDPEKFNLEELGDGSETLYPSLYSTKQKIDNLTNLLESL
jgi:hypothetical protein